MPLDITKTMAFQGATPWDGIGSRLDDKATPADWLKTAGMDWQALTAVPHFTRADGTVGTMDDKRIIYRSDTGAALSAMGAGYQIVQPREVMGFFDSITRDHGMKLHTAGTLDSGRRLWALAINGHGGEVVKGDKVRQFLMLATSLDGTTATVATWTQVRVVCANTLAMAMQEGARNIGRDKEARAAGRMGPASAVKVSHKSAFDPEAVKRAMGLADTAWNTFAEQAAKLADTPVDVGTARDVLRGIFGEPLKARGKTASEAPAAPAAPASPIAAATGGDTLSALLQGAYVPKVDPTVEAREDLARILAKGDAKEQKSVARCLALFAGEGRGSQHPGVAGTAWGLLNAVTEHVDHEMGRSRDTALTSAWFGRGAQFKQQTLADLLAL